MEYTSRYTYTDNYMYIHTDMHTWTFSYIEFYMDKPVAGSQTLVSPSWFHSELGPSCIHFPLQELLK